MKARTSREQFDAHAEKYAQSVVHSAGPSLPLLLELAQPRQGDVALDVATGTGNTAFALAPSVKHITAIDLSSKMLEKGRTRADREGVENIHFVEGSAEHLPCEPETFTLVTSRHAPHHFTDVAAFLSEVHRVLVPGGRLVMADQITPFDAALEWTERWQRLRDPSHFKQRTVEQWRALTEKAGFTWVREQFVSYQLPFDWWVEQSGCDDETIRLLREHAETASADVRDAYRLEFGEGGIDVHQEPMVVVRLEKA